MLIGEEVRKLREERGMTQAQLAEGFTTSSYISYIERTNSVPSRSILQSIAERLGVTIAIFDVLQATDPRVSALIRMEKLRALIDVGDAEKAQRLADELELENAVDQDFQLQARLAFCRGLLSHQQGAMDKALIQFNKADECYVKANQKVGQIETLYWLSVIHHGRREIDLAQRYCRSAAGLAAEGLCEPDLTYRIQLNLGLILHDMGDYEEARDIYKSLSSSQEQLTPKVRAELLLGLSDTHTKSGDLDQALEYATKARVLAEGQSDTRLLASSEMRFAESLIRQHKYTDALPFIQNSMDKWEAAGNNEETMALLIVMRARVEVALQRFKEAENFVQKALKLDWQVNGTEPSPTKAESYLVRAQMQKEERYLSEAKSNYENAGRIYQSCEMFGLAADCLKQAADIMVRLDEPIKAYNMLSHALDLLRKSNSSKS